MEGLNIYSFSNTRLNHGIRKSKYIFSFVQTNYIFKEIHQKIYWDNKINYARPFGSVNEKKFHSKFLYYKILRNDMPK